MARPKKDNAEYFSHDKDMRNDAKIKALRRKFSFEGYAIWCMMLEHLTDCDFFEYEWSELNIELIAGDFDCEPELLENIIKYCVDTLKLFEIENNKLSSFQHRKRFDTLLTKRKRDRSRVSASDNTHSIVKESKVKESKEEKGINKFILVGEVKVFDVHSYLNKNNGSSYEAIRMNQGISLDDIENWFDDVKGRTFINGNNIINSIRKYKTDGKTKQSEESEQDKFLMSFTKDVL